MFWVYAVTAVVGFVRPVVLYSTFRNNGKVLLRAE